jgi:hypothetical protein
MNKVENNEEEHNWVCGDTPPPLKEIRQDLPICLRLLTDDNSPTRSLCLLSSETTGTATVDQGPIWCDTSSGRSTIYYRYVDWSSRDGGGGEQDPAWLVFQYKEPHGTSDPWSLSDVFLRQKNDWLHWDDATQDWKGAGSSMRIEPCPIPTNGGLYPDECFATTNTVQHLISISRQIQDDFIGSSSKLDQVFIVVLISAMILFACAFAWTAAATSTNASPGGESMEGDDHAGHRCADDAGADSGSRTTDGGAVRDGTGGGCSF